MQQVAVQIVYILLKGLALLPLRVLYLLSDICTPILYYLVRYRRHLVRANLTAAYPNKSIKDIRAIERGFYHHFCDYIVETVKLLHISDNEMRRRLTFKNMELIERLRTDGRPFFIYLGHYGNWEYVTSLTLWCSSELTACQVYHPLSSKMMDALMLRLRARFHSIGIRQEQTFHELLHMKDKGQQAIIGLIADQRPPKKHHDIWTTFLRQPTALLTGSERIGQRLNAHFIYGDMECPRRGHYIITLKEMNSDEGNDFPMSRQYMHLLEQSIDRAPQYYLWSHNRWKWALDVNGALFRNR